MTAAAALQNRFDTFAANRASGHIALAIGESDGRSRRRRVHEEGSLRVRFPNPADDLLEAVIVNTAGGMAGGDRFAIDISLGDDAGLLAGTAAAEKIYRSIGPDTELGLSLKVGAGARLAWLPQETILFDRARLSRRVDVDLAAGASLVMAEAVVFGRTAMGETVAEGCFRDSWRVRVGGRLVLAESVRFDGAIADKLGRPAVAAGGVAVATVLIVPGDESKLAAVRSLADRYIGEVGMSAWNGIAVARLCAADGAALRHDLIAVLAALGAPLPRLWLN